MSSFSDFGLLPSLYKSLKEKKIVKPTEIQSGIIPMMMGGSSVVGIAETGSGKTLAYALPLLNLLKTLEDQGEPVETEATPRAVVMVPTRELGDQVSKVFKTLTHETRLRVRPALGGMPLEQARRNVSGAFEILLATPGRLVQLLDLELIHLTDVRMLIFDEADQMLDQGFLPDSNTIVEACPQDVRLGLFSATVSLAVQELMNTLFHSAEVFRSSGSGKTVKSLVTRNLIVKDGKRWPLFEKLLAQPSDGGTLVFTNTREQCDKLAQELTEKGYLCGIYRGEMDKNERRQNFKNFRDGKIDLLISTDLASRGLDIETVGRVINFHLPQQLENYLHRVGRTARAGRTGLVINLVTERDERLMTKLGVAKQPSDQYRSRPEPFSKNSEEKGAHSKGRMLQGSASKSASAKATPAKRAATKQALPKKAAPRSAPSRSAPTQSKRSR